MTTQLDEARSRAIADPGSEYYVTLCRILEESSARYKEAMDKRVDMVVPYPLTPSVVADLERRFGWKVSGNDHGVRTRLPCEVAALGFCMSMQCMLTMGSAGEETVWVDGDLPVVVMKQLGYVHVCRTYASNTLVAGYRMENAHLQRMAMSTSKTVSGTASSILSGMAQGTTTRVCDSAARCRSKADTVIFDHTRTPVSLAQVVATARQHGCSAARGWFYFQPEMTMVKEGPTQAFPGQYRVDEARDRVTFIPESAPDAAFVHPLSDLLSFVYNHEYVDATGRWLVEKHGNGDGVIRYVVSRVDLSFEFPEELGLSYPVAEAAKWVELAYPTRMRGGRLTSRWRRDTVRLPKVTFDKTMGTLLTMEASQLSWEAVVTVARNHNNMVVVGGNSVRKPERVWSDILARAAAPMLALAVVRREASSAVLRAGLAAVRKRSQVVNAGWLCLAFEAAKAAVGAVAGTSVAALVGDSLCDLASVELQEAGLSCDVQVGESSVEVIQQAGLAPGDGRSYGSVRSWLPGAGSGRASVIARAKSFYHALTRSRAVTGMVSSESSDSVAEGDPDPPSVVVAETVEATETPPSVEGVKKKLFHKLMAEQDVLSMGRIPREVERFETLDAPDVVKVPVPDGVEAAAQDEYDDYMPNVSLVDPDTKAYMASVSDVDMAVSLPMVINDAKREVPPAQMVMTSKWRAAAAGTLPRYQGGLLAAVDKRNGCAIETRGIVDFTRDPAAAVSKVFDVAFRDDWQERLAGELSNGMWQINEEDLALHLPKLETSKCERMLEEWFSTSDVNMQSWLVMTKGQAKPPVDVAAASKVPLPQTILYNESSTMNTLYSSMLGHVHKAVDAMLKPQFKLNLRGAPVEFERWFNSLEPVRRGARQVHRYEGDSYNYDSSLELMAASVVLTFYRRMGFDGTLYERYKKVYGVKRAACLMHGVLMWIVNQGVSGIFDTLFRNGLVTFAAVLTVIDLPASDILSLAVTGDDYLLETVRRVEVGLAVEGLALTFNFSAKFFSVEHMYFCSRYLVQVDGWWYWVADPLKKYEKANASIKVGNGGDGRLREIHDALRVDLRHYDDWRILEMLALAVASRHERPCPPYAIVQVLAAWADSFDRYRRQRLPARRVALV